MLIDKAIALPGNRGGSSELGRHELLDVLTTQSFVIVEISATGW